MIAARDLAEVVRTTGRLLIFKAAVPDLKRLEQLYLSFGLLVTWLAGVGRYWDNPRAHVWQYLGLGSVAYVFVLAAILYVVVKPLKPENWDYRPILIFVCLTSPPALLYAIPVERFMSLPAAQSANLTFLLVVAAWRVALLYVFLRRSARLPIWFALVGTLMPIMLIIFGLSLLNLEHAVFEIMAGLRSEDEQTSSDLAYGTLVGLSLASMITFFTPALLVIYIGMCIVRAKAARSAQASSSPPP